MVNSPPASVSVTPQYSQANPARSRTSRRVAAEIVTLVAPHAFLIADAASRHFRAEVAHSRRTATRSAASQRARMTEPRQFRPEVDPEPGKAARRRAWRYPPHLSSHTMLPSHLPLQRSTPF